MSEVGARDGRVRPVAVNPSDLSPDPVHDAAIAAYERRMRPRRRAYAAVVGLIVLIAAVIVVLVYRAGELSHVVLRTVVAGPAAPATAPLPPTVTARWSTTDDTALGTPVHGGTIVVHDAHTVRGRDVRTGRETWSYTRSDRTVCAAMQDGGVTVAVYRLHGHCDELTALNTDTGARRWNRTLDKDGAEFNAPPTAATVLGDSFQVVPGRFVLVSDSSIYAIASGGLDYWTFHHPGCTISGAVSGAAGTLIAQTCSGQDCADRRFCGQGAQLLLRQATAAYDDNSDTNKNNPDRIVWNRLGTSLVPVSAGTVVAAREPDGTRLHLLDEASGAVRAGIAPAGGRARSPSAVSSTTDADLVWIGGTVYAVRAGADVAAWQAASRGPVAVGPPGAPTPLDSAELLSCVADGVRLLDPQTGRVTRTISAQGVTAGSVVTRVGAGFVVLGTTTTAYR